MSDLPRYVGKFSLRIPSLRKNFWLADLKPDLNYLSYALGRIRRTEPVYRDQPTTVVVLLYSVK